MSERKTLFRLLALLAVCLLAFGACGGDDDGGGDNGTTEDTGDTGDAGGGLALTAADNSWSPNTLSAPAGEEVTIEITNDGSNPHSFVIDGVVEGDTIDGGSTGSVTFEVPDGESQWVCGIHGTSMSGTLTSE